jgi:hypothetical protein
MVGGAGSGSGLCDQSAAADFCRPCVGSSAGLVHACILDAGGQPITASFDASVIVVSVDEAPFDACTAATGTASAPSSRLVVEASDQTRWTVVLGMPDLPPSFAEPTDNLELSVVASPRVHIFDYADQTIKLWRSNTLVAFAAMATFNDITGLADTGIAFLGGEERCRYPGIGCTVIMRSTRLSAGGMESVFLLGETRVLGPFSITVDEAYGYQSNGSCDGVSTRQIAGFALPP